MRLSTEQRIRIVYLYVINKLEIVKNRFEVLRELTQKEDICVSKLTLFKTIKKWQTTYSFCNKRSVNQRLAHTKINNREMMRIHNEILKNREATARFIKNKFNIKASVRTIQRYIRILGFIFIT